MFIRESITNPSNGTISCAGLFSTCKQPSQTSYILHKGIVILHTDILKDADCLNYICRATESFSKNRLLIEHANNYGK